MRRAPVALVVIVCVGGAAGCGPDWPDQLTRSEHVRYFTRAGDDDVCPALLDELEEHGQVIADRMGIERPSIAYYKYETVADYTANAECGPGASACARNATVNSTVAFDRHELIHAYLAPYGSPPRLFMEGAAVALSCEHYPRPEGSWRDALTADRLSPDLYGAGGWLVGYLMRMFRKTWFVNLYGSLQINATEKEIAAVFQSIYGMSLDDIWAAAIGGKQEPVVCPWECGRPAIPADGSPHELAAACGAGATQRTVDVPGEGITRWTLEGGASVSVRSCDGFDSPLQPITSNTARGGLLAPLTTGKYIVEASISSGSWPVTLSIDTNGLAALSTPYCGAVPPVPDDLSQYNTLTLFFPTSVGPQFTTFLNGDARSAAMTVTAEGLVDISVCEGGCDTACTTFVRATSLPGITTPAGLTLGVPPGPPVTVNISWIGS